MGTRITLTVQDLDNKVRELNDMYRHDKQMLAIKMKAILDQLPDNMSQRVTSKNGFYFTLEDDTE